jgi:hypothetical protein
MGKILRDSLAFMARRIGYGVFKQTSREDMLRLLSRLHPCTTGHQLVRIGGSGDGGYLVPDDLDGVRCCVSPGVAETARFETDLEGRGIPSILADASVSGPPCNAAHMAFERKFVGLKDAGELTTIDAWVSRHAAASQGDLILQMDIEGSEWSVLGNVSAQLLQRFRIILVELHSLEALAHPFCFRAMSEVLDRILKDFVVVHLHPNNASPIQSIRGVLVPSTLEVTLLRRDRVKTLGFVRQLPHPLDEKNVSGKTETKLSSDWIRMTSF